MRMFCATLLIVVGAMPGKAEETPTATQLKAAVQKSLPFMQKEGVAWMTDRKCQSCHQIPAMVGSLNEAARHGLEVDAAKLASWNQWLLEKSPAGGGGLTMQLAAATLTGAISGPNADKARQKFFDTLIKEQQPDGLWKPAGQFTAQKWSVAEASAANALTIVLALDHAGPLPEKVSQARAKALAALRKTHPIVSVETITWQLRLAGSLKDQPRVRELTAELFRLQHADGGWGWRKDATDSDAFTTGQVLFALGSVVPHGEPAIQKAQGYLLRTQKQEGNWYVPREAISKHAKPDRKSIDAVYRYWGTGWAILGLLATMPVQ